MSGIRASSSDTSAIALVQPDHEWQPVFHVSNQVVLYNPTSHALSIRPSTTSIPDPCCPYCKQSLPVSFQHDSEVVDHIDSESDPAYHSRASDYFQLLAIANETSSRPSTPPPLLQEQKSTFPAEKMADGYFKAFFQEEYKLGMGANGSVFLCQHMLDGNPLGHFAVKKIAVGESHSYLLTILREVRLLERLHHPNIITYHHAWLENCRFSSFGPKVPTLHVLMQWAEGGSLDDFIDVRLGRAAQHIHINPLAQFSFSDTASSSHIDFTASGSTTPPLHGSSTGSNGGSETHSRSARIRAFRKYQHATPAERERMRREMEGSGSLRSNGRHSTSWKAVHLLRADEVKSLFQDIVSGLAFLHNKSILHLDLKPGNVLLTWDEGKLIPRAMLSDFGTSRDMLHSSRNRTGNTGTLEYTSPESLPSPLTGLLGQIDSKSDMWSLGMILHKLLFFTLPYRYASKSDTQTGENLSAEREGDKLDRLEKEVVSYPGFKSTSVLVTAFEARRLPRSFLVLLESLLNIVPSSRPSCERVSNAIREGKFDPLADDALGGNASSALGPVVALRRSEPPAPQQHDLVARAGGEGIEEKHSSLTTTDDAEADREIQEEEMTPKLPPTTLSSAKFSDIDLDEKAQLSSPSSSTQSQPQPQLGSSSAMLSLVSPSPSLLAKRSVDSVVPVSVPRAVWVRALKSCILTAKVLSISSICIESGGRVSSFIMLVLLFGAVLDTVVDRFWVSVVLGVVHVVIVGMCPSGVCCTMTSP